MLTIGLNVFFLYSDELKTGKVKAIITEETSKGTTPVKFKIDTEVAIYTVDANRVSASLEGVFKFVFEDYRATAKSVKGRTGSVPKELKWDKIFTAQNTMP